MQNYKSIHAAVMICATWVSTRNKWLDLVWQDSVSLLIYGQWHSQEFTKRGQTNRSGDKSPQWVPGQNMENLENTNGAVTKIDLW